VNNRIDKQIDSLVAALTDPIVVFDPSWADTLPDWLKGEIKMQRLIQLMTGEEGVATDAEALAYVSNASLSVPLSSEWVDIYQYLLTKVMTDKVPGELRKESLDDRQEGIPGDLKQWLWQQRIKGRKQKAEEAKAEAKAPKQLRLGV
jgi:hypothetical protein